MRIYLKNNTAKFYADPIWNDVQIFSEDGRPNKKKNIEHEEEEQDE